MQYGKENKDMLRKEMEMSLFANDVFACGEKPEEFANKTYTRLTGFRRSRSGNQVRSADWQGEAKCKRQCRLYSHIVRLK